MRYIVLLAVMILSGCSLFGKGATDFSCPKTGLIADAATLTLSAPGGKEKGVEAVLQGFSGDCTKTADGIEMTLALPFAAKRNPAAAALQEQQLPYFIAVLSPNEDILQRQAFSTTISFDNTNTGTSTEEHTISIPLPAGAQAYGYKVIAGFALTPDQLRYNKEHK
jgi:hypothetical protein